MKISVVIATYNGEKFIGEQLKSLTQQIYPPNEVVICDDSPNNLTLEAIIPFRKHLNILYFHNDKTLGVNENFAKALSLSTGDIIFLCDQDDFWHHDKISKMVDTLKKNPNSDGVFCNSNAVNENQTPLGFSLWQMRNFTTKMQKDIDNGNSLKVFVKRVTLSAHNIAFRRRILKHILPFPPLGPFYPDTWIGLRIALISNWVKINESLTDYRIHQNNQSSPKLTSLIEQMQLSQKARNKNSIAWTISLADSLLIGLPDNTHPKKIHEIHQFKKHYMNRNCYSTNFIIRLLQISIEILSLRYLYYSNGWKSVVADILLHNVIK